MLLTAFLLVGHDRILAQGTLFVRPALDSYTVAAGQRLTVNVVIDPVPLSGLFSYGVTLVLDSIKATLAGGDIIVPPPLRFNGFAGGEPFVQFSDSWAGVKGTVDATATPIVYYRDSVIATFVIQVLGEVGASFPVQVGLFRTLGPTESVFVDGNGTVLDERLAFGSAQVTIIPEPRPLHLLIFAEIAMLAIARIVRFLRNGATPLERPAPSQVEEPVA